MDKLIYEAIIIGIVGIFLILAIMISMFISLIGYKKWASKRDEHYTEKHDALEKKVDHIESSHNDVVEKAAEVIKAAKDLITKK
jgi:predicted negative regulator of RcsB-dependent stress response